MNDKTTLNSDRLVNAYKDMMEKLHQLVDKAQHDVTPRILHALEAAKDNAVKVGELTREEAEKVGDYVIRDLHDAADFLEENRAEFKDWISLEVDLIEDKILDSLPPLIDETRLALEQLKQRADTMGEWHTGEIASPGAFECKQCGKKIELHKTGHIPPCASCKGTIFKRLRSQ